MMAYTVVGDEWPEFVSIAEIDAVSTRLYLELTAPLTNHQHAQQCPSEVKWSGMFPFCHTHQGRRHLPSYWDRISHQL